MSKFSKGPKRRKYSDLVFYQTGVYEDMRYLQVELPPAKRSAVLTKMQLKRNDGDWETDTELTFPSSKVDPMFVGIENGTNCQVRYSDADQYMNWNTWTELPPVLVADTEPPEQRDGDATQTQGDEEDLPSPVLNAYKNRK